MFFLKKYAKWVDDLKQNNKHFVPITTTPFKRKKDTPKIFAYYLTQFHAIPENDKAHGKGFTEWTNVASATPQFIGHYQPKIPYDVGFYNLTDINIMKRQAELANMYGVYGWCFYYYWFSGKKVLEKPLENFLNSDIDLHFHLCWANENWSKLWDGGDKEVILEQKLENNDADKFFNDILPFIQDCRYEKIDNKPILMIYRPNVFEQDKLKIFLNKINNLAIQHGFAGFYFMSSNAMSFNKPIEWGFNGIIEFPPHDIFDKCNKKHIKKVSKKVNINVVSLKSYLKQHHHLKKHEFTVFKTCFPSWDNTPRKAYSNGYCFDMDYNDFQLWLSDIITWTKKHNPKNMQYVYINAWNEWAEGAILEPTTRYGYRTLDIIKQTLEQS